MTKTRTQRWRVLFFAEAVTLAHVARPITLARALDPERFEVVLACHPRYLELFPDIEFRQINIDSITSEAFLAALANGRRVYSRRQLELYVEEDLKIIDTIKPDLIIGDFRLSLAVSAPLSQIPYCTVTNAYWSPYSKASFPLPEHPMTRIVGIKTAHLLFNLMRPIVFAWHALPLNQVRRRYGLPSIGRDLRETYTWADHVLYADVPELSSIENVVPNHHFLGPVLWAPSISLPDWWQELPTDRPVIYLNFGSSGRHDLLSMMLEALADEAVTIVVATLGKEQAISMPKNVFSAPYLPGNEVAARANLVICNGGSPSSQQALSVGTPVLGIPSNMDQHMNMALVERYGAGVLLRSERVTLQSVRETVMEMLENSKYRIKAAEVELLYQRYRASERFQQFLEIILPT